MSGVTRTAADLKAFALQYMRNPFGAVFAIAFPIILLSTFGAIFGGSETRRVPEVHIVVQDLDQTVSSSHFYESMNQIADNQIGSFNVYPTEPTYDMSEDIIREYDLTGALVIPAGFEANLLNNTPINVALYADQSTRTYDVMVEAVEAAIGTFESNQAVPKVIGIETTDILVGEGFVFIDFLLPGVIAAAVMINCLMILSSLMADYWAHGYFKILKTTPLKKWEWILSKLIWYVIVMAVSVVLMLAVGVGVFRSNATITPVAIALILAGTLLFSSIGILIGAWAKNSDTAAGLSQAIGQPMLWLSGIFWQLDELPRFIQVIAKALPLTYFGRGLRETMINGNDTAALKDLAVVLVLAVALFIVASNLISWKEK
jgi:ABC-type multidrug transport system permease subunit